MDKKKALKPAYQDRGIPTRYEQTFAVGCGVYGPFFSAMRRAISESGVRVIVQPDYWFKMNQLLIRCDVVVEGTKEQIRVFRDMVPKTTSTANLSNLP